MLSPTVFYDTCQLSLIRNCKEVMLPVKEVDNSHLIFMKCKNATHNGNDTYLLTSSTDDPPEISSSLRTKFVS